IKKNQKNFVERTIIGLEKEICLKETNRRKYN
ncbi:hypothetical protein LCGC14_1525300, partial [marine sediment metagenome]